MVQNKINYNEIMKKFPKINNQSNISRIMEMKDKIIKAYEGFCNKKKSLKTTPNQEFKKKLKNFVNMCTSNKIGVSMPVIQETAISLGKQMNVLNVKSKGYFQKFCKRNNIELLKVYGEANSVPQEKTEHWFNELPKLIKDYEPRNIFNIDELGLFYKLLPKKTYIVKRQTFKGGKKVKKE